MSGFVKQLVDLTGLDDETVSAQIVPYLETFPTKQALTNHLQELLGPGSAQKNFISLYSDHRFPLKPAPAASPAPLASNKDVVSSSAALSAPTPKPSQVRKTKGKFPSKLPPPRKIDAESFGPVGSVYRKNQEDDLLFASSTSSRVPTPIDRTKDAVITHSANELERNESSRVYQEPAKGAQETLQAETPASISTTVTPSGGPEYSMMDTEEMKNLRDTISLLHGTSQDDPVRKAKPCFCQAGRHSIHPHVPLCLTCGLILCCILSPSPMLLPSPSCPSCASPLLSPTSRAILLAKLDSTLASLTQSQEEKVRLIREERQKAWKEKREEVVLFPDLQPLSQSITSAHAGSSKAQEYNHFYERRRAMDIAMGRKVDDNDQRKSRVLRIGGGKGKGAAVKKKKKVPSQLPPKTVGDEKKMPNIKSEQEPIKVDDRGADTDSEEEEEHGYDAGDDLDEPQADPYDDGFAQHATSFPSGDLTSAPNSLSWGIANPSLPPVQYIAKHDRTIDQLEEVDEDELNTSKAHHIPGSLKEETKMDTGKGQRNKAKRDIDQAETSIV